MGTVKYKPVIKDGLLHFPDKYIKLSEATKILSVSKKKLEQFIENRMLIWEQPKNKRTRYIEIKSLSRLKNPENDIEFPELTVKDAGRFRKVIDEARHKIVFEANLPPAAIKIYFDLG